MFLTLQIILLPRINFTDSFALIPFVRQMAELYHMPHRSYYEILLYRELFVRVSRSTYTSDK